MAYQIPRNVRGEGRILFIFSTKALITTGIGAGIGILILWIIGLAGISLGIIRSNNSINTCSNRICDRHF